MVSVDDEKSRNRKYLALLILLIMCIPPTINIVYIQFDTSKAVSDEDILPGEGLKPISWTKKGMSYLTEDFPQVTNVGISPLIGKAVFSQKESL